jgi:hypothetical protein
MKKKLLLTNLFNNITFSDEFYLKWENMFKTFAKNLDADFLNFKVDKSICTISKNYKHFIGEAFLEEFPDGGGLFVNKNLKERKLSQLTKLDYIDNAFENGYETVCWVDSDMVINPNANSMWLDNLIDNSTIYFDTSGNNGLANLKKCLKNNFLENNNILYGNCGIICVTKKTWNDLRNTLINSKNILSFVKSDCKFNFIKHIEQNILSVAMTLTKCNIDYLTPKKFKTSGYDFDFIHVINQHKNFQEFLSLSNDDIDKIKRNYFNGFEGRLTVWLWILYSYLNLNENEKLSLFQKFRNRII